MPKSGLPNRDAAQRFRGPQWPANRNLATLQQLLEHNAAPSTSTHSLSRIMARPAEGSMLIKARARGKLTESFGYHLPTSLTSLLAHRAAFINGGGLRCISTSSFLFTHHLCLCISASDPALRVAYRYGVGRSTWFSCRNIPGKFRPCEHPF